MSGLPVEHSDAASVADAVIDALDGHIVMALPLGLGKAVSIANAIFARAIADPGIDLTIFTALTLEKPRGSSDMERRFVEPLAERLFPDYPGLAYAEALREGELPPNIRVSEFFLLAGQWLGVDAVQRGYVSANYTHAARYILDRGINLIAQLVARRGTGPDARYSLSCNTDITLDILPAQKARGERCLLVGEVSSELPYMTGEAELPATAFDHMLDGPSRDDRLFVVPRQPVSDADHAVGLHAASLVKDGGTLQIGIGSLGDALTAGLVLRHRDPALYRETLATLGGGFAAAETGPFETGLYAASEMFVDGFMDLYREGILKRPAADGALLHSGFFVGSDEFYRFLRELPDEDRALFSMRAISFVNDLYGNEQQKRADRKDARFVNNAMMATLLGAVVSDALDDGRVVSGVGGQYNFVAQAFALEDSRSLITLNATRTKGAERQSRLVWAYGHNTIPRHLRDIVVTEYGVADLRGKSDRDCVVAMLDVADAAFQGELLEQAKSAGKIEKDYMLPATARDNTPARVKEALAKAKAAGWCATFPFGSAFTDEEKALLPALERLKRVSASKLSLASALAGTLGAKAPDADERLLLARMALDEPGDFVERLYARLLLWALRQTG